MPINLYPSGASRVKLSQVALAERRRDLFMLEVLAGRHPSDWHQGLSDWEYNHLLGWVTPAEAVEGVQSNVYRHKRGSRGGKRHRRTPKRN